MVYILGASHVSRASCDCVRELIEAVRPDVVLVELCKDRLGLLVDPVRPTSRSGPCGPSGASASKPHRTTAFALRLK